MELEWKISGRKSRWDMLRKWKGNGMEWKILRQIKWKQILMEWNGNGMELKWKHSIDEVYMIVYQKWEWSRQKKTKKFSI